MQNIRGDQIFMFFFWAIVVISIIIFIVVNINSRKKLQKKSDEQKSKMEQMLKKHKQGETIKLSSINYPNMILVFLISGFMLYVVIRLLFVEWTYPTSLSILILLIFLLIVGFTLHLVLKQNGTTIYLKADSLYIKTIIKKVKKIPLNNINSVKWRFETRDENGPSIRQIHISTRNDENLILFVSADDEYLALFTVFLNLIKGNQENLISTISNEEILKKKDNYREWFYSKKEKV